ncbi:MAG TPA: hypothetical protein VH142_20610 [Polyangiaceae bacterium]|nr:hypothetical protein [Polyangiaceae bacterium]
MRTRLAWWVSLIVLAGCSSDGGTDSTRTEPDTTTPIDGDSGSIVIASACAPSIPKKCPSDAPMYTADVLPILEARCTTCHNTKDGPWPLTDYQEVVDWRSQVLGDLAGCTMPPADAGVTLSSDERETLITWLVCGAKHD